MSSANLNKYLMTRNLVQNQFNNLQLERNKKVLNMWQIVIFVLLFESSYYETTSASPLVLNHHHQLIRSNEVLPALLPQPVIDTKNSTESLPWQINDYATGSKFADSPHTNEFKSNHESESDEAVDFAPQDKEDEHESIEKIPTNCPQCKNIDTLSEDDLTKLRIEYVKKQILHKLRLTERPKPLKISDLPEPVQIGYSIETDRNEEMFNRRSSDQDFAKTTQKIVFMTQGWFALISIDNRNRNHKF